MAAEELSLGAGREGGAWAERVGVERKELLGTRGQWLWGGGAGVSPALLGPCLSASLAGMDVLPSPSGTAAACLGQKLLEVMISIGGGASP